MVKFRLVLIFISIVLIVFVIFIAILLTQKKMFQQKTSLACPAPENPLFSYSPPVIKGSVVKTSDRMLTITNEAGITGTIKMGEKVSVKTVPTSNQSESIALYKPAIFELQQDSSGDYFVSAIDYLPDSAIINLPVSDEPGKDLYPVKYPPATSSAK